MSRVQGSECQKQGMSKAKSLTVDVAAGQPATVDLSLAAIRAPLKRRSATMRRSVRTPPNAYGFS
jgi:hypothetical protein